MIKKSMLFLFSGLGFFASILLYAGASDFRSSIQVNLGAKVNHLAVNQDRFLISLDKANQKLKFFDTWNWRNISAFDIKSLGSGDTVEWIAVGQSKTLYLAGGSKRKIGWLNLADLDSLEFGESVSGLTLEGTTTLPYSISGQAWVIESSTAECLFVPADTGSRYHLYRLYFQDGVLKNQAEYMNTLNVSSIHFTASKEYVFARYYSGVFGAQLSAYQCSLAYTPTVLDPTSFPSILALGIDEYGEKLISSDTTTLAPKLKAYKVYKQPSPSKMLDFDLINDFNLSHPAKQLWVKKFYGEEEVLVFFREEGDFRALALNGNTLPASGDRLVGSFSDTSFWLAESSSADGYLYLAVEDSKTVSVITANPRVYNLNLLSGATIITEPGGVIESDTFRIRFNYDKGRYYYLADCPDFAIKHNDCEKTLSYGSLGSANTVEIILSALALNDGKHNLGVFVRDSTSSPLHQGRNAIQAEIDLAPPPQNFSLKFGDEKIIIEFKSPNVADLAEYIVYYGTNDSAPLDQPELLDDTGGDGEPNSPITISYPQPNKEYKIVVYNLVNGTTYYAQIRTEDKGGKYAISERKNTIPQEVQTPSEMAGEKGGFNCLGSIAGTKRELKASEFVIWVCPAIVLLIIKIRLRRRR